MRNTARNHDGAPSGPRPAGIRRALEVVAGLSLVAAALGGCATGGQPEAEAPALVVRYSVEPGDRLSTIAQDFTGDMTVWRTLAELNGIDDPRRLSVGRMLEIPVALIPEADREARLEASAPLPEDAPASDDDVATRSAALSGDDGVGANDESSDAPPARASLPLPSASAVRVTGTPVVVSPVRSREAFELAPLDTAQVDAAADAGARFIKVLGSYTPKGIYERPEAQSRVIMRVTPGTIMRLERSVSGWHEVDTAAGAGFLRDTDAQLVPPDPAVAGAGD